jgi:hypothetical protein
VRTIWSEDCFLFECADIFFSISISVPAEAQQLNIPENLVVSEKQQSATRHILLGSLPSLFFLSFSLHLFPRALLCAFLSSGDTWHDIVERVVSDPNGFDLWRAAIISTCCQEKE